MRETDQVRAVHVVVPVRDEELMLARCLDALSESVSDLRAVRPAVAVRVTVVLDQCVDASAVIARDHGVHCVEVRAGAVGAARAAGVDHTRPWLAQRTHSPEPPAAQVWVATTDADSCVPVGWLAEHVTLAETGHDLVVGPIRLDPADGPASVQAAWQRAHPPGVAAVYGANLGFRLDHYERVGGFAPTVEHEDVRLVAALGAAGARVARSTLPVTTSARTTGRTPGGLAGYLVALADQPA